MPSMLSIDNLTVRYGALTVLRNVSFTVEAGQWLMIVGPNGAGKSTIVSAVGQGAPYTGTVQWEGSDIRRLSARARAQRIGILAQTHHVGYAFTVEDVVRLGRYAYARGILPNADPRDTEAVHRALELTGMLSLRGQSVLTLSGGELQRTFLAQCFAQDPQLLILDEPTNHLDLVYQKQVFELIGTWLREPGAERAVISVVHDLSLARAYGTDALLLHEGNVMAQGTAYTVLTREHLAQVYALDVYDWMRGLLAQWQE